MSGAPGEGQRRVVFLDKDGTLVEDVPYNVAPERIHLVPGAGPALRRLAAAGYDLSVISNQSGVARGLFPIEALEVVRDRLSELLREEGVKLAGFAWCPHHPDGTTAYAVACDCRKPAPGLLLAAGADLGADLGSSWMIGDILDDVEAGRRAGCRTILLDVGHETEWVRTAERRPDAIARSLGEAAEVILAAGPRAPSLGAPTRRPIRARGRAGATA